MRFFNKLERRFGKYAIHSLMYYIIIAYIMSFVMMYMDPMFSTQYLSLDAEATLHGQVWKLVISLLYLPTLSPPWIIFVALMYYSLGRSLEVVWRALRLNVFFFIGATDIIPAEFIVHSIRGWDIHLNTSYLNMSIFLACAVILPEEYLYIYFALVIKAKWLALLDALFLALGFIYGSFPQRITIFLSTANFIIFFLATEDFRKYSPREVKRRQDFKVRIM